MSRRQLAFLFLFLTALGIPGIQDAIADQPLNKTRAAEECALRYLLLPYRKRPGEVIVKPSSIRPPQFPKFNKPIDYYYDFLFLEFSPQNDLATKGMVKRLSDLSIPVKSSSEMYVEEKSLPVPRCSVEVARALYPFRDKETKLPGFNIFVTGAIWRDSNTADVGIAWCYGRSSAFVQTYTVDCRGRKYRVTARRNGVDLPEKKKGERSEQANATVGGKLAFTSSFEQWPELAERQRILRWLERWIGRRQETLQPLRFPQGWRVIFAR